MKKFGLVAVAVIAMSVIPLVSAGASTTEAQKTYLTSLHHNAPSTKAVSNKKLLGLGKSLCSGLDFASVASEVGLLEKASNSFHFPKKQVTAIVATSVTSLCPSHTKAVKAFEAKPKAKPSSPKVTTPPVTAPPVTTPPVTAPPVTAPPVTTPPAPALTQQEQNAVQDAESYLSTEPGFSQQGLIQQLSGPGGDGFSVADATAAVDSLTVNWNAQAVDDAQNYNSTEGGFSCSGMIQQLSGPGGDGFTVAQATYGATQAGDC